MKSYYLYIVTNKNNTVLYTGVTNDLFRRSNEHKSHLGSAFTRKYNVGKLVYFEEFSSINDAIKREKQIKAGSRADKEKLINSINSEWIDLFDNANSKKKGIASSPSWAPRNDVYSANTFPINNRADKLQVLYEDNHLIAVYKPAGILAQADETGDVCLMEEVKKYLKEKYNKPGEAFLGMIHRLDRPVSGIVLFAKTSKGASRLAEQFRNHTVSKIYHALVFGRPKKDKGTLVHFLIKDKEKNITSSYQNKVAGSLRAELDYEIVKEGKESTLLKINLKTGRPHQIRAQLAAIGCPIVGDVKYGGPKWDKQNEIALRAVELSFNLAAKDERKTLNINMPEAWAKYL